jgi:predicted enzyme related to lactoylglutathione lyase
MSNGSGDFVIAFSTSNPVPHASESGLRIDEILGNDFTSPLFLATVEAVEEAVLNSIFKATTVTGFGGRTREALPIELLEQMMKAGEAPTGQEEHDQRIDYIELGATDMAASKTFYTAAFGWPFQDWGSDYASFEDGRLAGGLRQEDEVVRGGPLVILYAVDLEATEAAVRAAGGTIVQEIFSFPGGRRFHFLDPAGNELAVWSDR